jgi:hypothetical protein
VARARELSLEITGAERHLESLRTQRIELDALADEANLLGELERALAPPPVVPPTPMTRIKAIKHFKAIYGGPRGAEEFSGAAGTVNDVPTELLRQLKGRVVPAERGAEIVGKPLESWMDTSGD